MEIGTSGTAIRAGIVKPRLVWRLIGGNWTPFHRVTWSDTA